MDLAATRLATLMMKIQYDYSDYKYTVYRCASKLVSLQKSFYTANMPYKWVEAVLKRRGIETTDLTLMITPFELAGIIHDIYFSCEKLGHFTKISDYQLSTATAIMSNYLWNIFDPHRRHSISLLEIKVTFLILCKLHITDNLIKEFYNILLNGKLNCITRLSFEYFVNILIKTLTYIGEAAGYGIHNKATIMEECFAKCKDGGGLTEAQFYSLWTTSETRFVIYANLISLVKRIGDTEKIVHNNMCMSCSSDKIIGIRFKCQNCKNLSLCFRCFARGYLSNKHEAKHRMCEMFTEDEQPKRYSHYLAKLCDIFQISKKCEETKAFCGANETDIMNETELVTIGTSDSSDATLVVNKESKENEVSPFVSGLAATAEIASGRLQSIIDRLSLQNVKLEKQLKYVKTATHEEISYFLTKHQQFLLDIIKEMRHFSANGITDNSYPTSSTPNQSICINKNSSNIDDLGAAGAQLTHSINGADINRTYLDANKSDYSIKDVSIWFNTKASAPISAAAFNKEINIKSEIINGNDTINERETEMTSFKLLLNKVKEIVEDSYSDNTELAEATQSLENVLDVIIKMEEQLRREST